MLNNEHVWDIFLAHAGPDKEAAEILFSQLTPHCRVFLDSQCLNLGDDFDFELSKAQRTSRITVVLVSNSTEQAYYQREEIAAAINMARIDGSRHRVVPIYLHGFPPKGGGIHYGLQLKHGLSVPDISGGLTEVAQRLVELLVRVDELARPSAEADASNAASKSDETLKFEDADEAGARPLSAPGQSSPDAAALMTHSRDLCPPSKATGVHRSTSVTGGNRHQSEPDDSDPLPLVMNRTEQIRRLGEEVIEHRRSKPYRPFLCVIHGNELEWHSGFLARLKYELPQILGRWYPEQASPAAVEMYEMRLSLAEVNDKNWHEVFWKDLTKALFGEQPASRDDVLNLIFRTRLALMIYVPLSSKKLANVTLDKLTCFFEFWASGWQLSGKLLLFVCLSLQYQRGFEERQRFFLWKSAGLNDKLRRYVKQLDFSAYRDLYGVCLPELQAISQDDAEKAVKDDAVKRCYYATDRDVIRIYNTTELCIGDCVPMVRLIDELAKKRK